MKLQTSTHFFLQETGSHPNDLTLPSSASQCWWCGLPEGNKVHNTRTYRVNPRTKREEYTDK